MKKTLIVLAVTAFLITAVVTYAQGPIMRGGYGMGSGMMQGYWYEGGKDYQKFLDETLALRKQLHEKRFEYYEALRNPDTKMETLAKLEKEMAELEDKIYEKTPGRPFHGHGGYGYYGFQGCPKCW